MHHGPHQADCVARPLHANAGERARIGTLSKNLGDAVREATEIHLGALGVLRVGTSPLYVDRPYTPALALLRRQRPAVRVQVAIDVNDGLQAAPGAGELDLARHEWIPPRAGAARRQVEARFAE